jgi:hypothetical protein
LAVNVNDVSNARQLPKKLAACFGALVLLGGCSSRMNPSQRVLSSQWSLNTGRFVAAGVESFASLSVAEICGLADAKLVGKEFGFDFGGFEPSYEIGVRGAKCGFDATSDGFEGDRLDVRWYVGPAEAPDPAPSDLRTRSQGVVDGLPVSVRVNGELVDATLSLRDRVIRVETFTDNKQRGAEIVQHVLALLSVVHKRVAGMRPRPQPRFDAPVADVFAFSPAQLCSLLRDRTVAALGERPLNLVAASPDAFDISLVRSDVLWCTKGRAKVELMVNAWITRSYDDQAIRGLPSFSSIGLSDAEDPRSEQARLEVAASRVVDDGIEERVITLIAHGTAYNAESRAILRREMEHIIDELNRRLPQPLVYKLEDPFGTFDNEGNSSPNPISVPTQRPKELTRLPLGFGEPEIEPVSGG